MNGGAPSPGFRFGISAENAKVMTEITITAVKLEENIA